MSITAETEQDLAKTFGLESPHHQPTDMTQTAEYTHKQSAVTQTLVDCNKKYFSTCYIFNAMFQATDIQLTIEEIWDNYYSLKA